MFLGLCLFCLSIPAIGFEAHQNAKYKGNKNCEKVGLLLFSYQGLAQQYMKFDAFSKY